MFNRTKEERNAASKENRNDIANAGRLRYESDVSAYRDGESSISEKEATQTAVIHIRFMFN
jgi:hypothetical protein